MAKKHKQRPGGGSAIHSLDNSVLAETAARAQSEGRYKEAVEAYKELLKREQRPEWRDGLAAAYAGRASDLAAKDMLKEAIALWRTRAELCGTPLMAGPYLKWLARSGDTKTLLRAYAEGWAKAGKGSEDLGELERSLVSTVLVSPDADLVDIPGDAPLLCHRPAALAALAAYCNGEQALDDYLGAISFRSPYRDLRQILRALTMGESDPEAANAVLAKLPADSPFARLVAAMRTATAPAHRVLEDMAEMDDAARRLALELRGVPEGIQEVIKDLLKLGQSASPNALFDLLVRHRRSWPNSDFEALCRSFLPHAPDCSRLYRNSFGQMSSVDEARVLALQGELHGDRCTVEEQWLRAVKVLRERGGEDDRLQAALILRHLADLSAHNAVDSAIHEDAVHWLQQSLVLDPDDLQTTVQVIRARRQQQDLKAARALLEEALQRFADSPEILLEAMEVALAGNAFKKAVGYGKLVLRHDPINPRVRSSLGSAHMAHARKKIRNGKYDAARLELEQADEWLRSSADRGRLKVLGGLLEQGDGRLSEAQRLIREGIAELGGELVGQFHVSLEAKRLFHDPAKTLKALGVKPPKSLAAAEVLNLVRVFDTQRIEYGLLWAALTPFAPVLRKAASLAFSEQEHLLICEVLSRLDLRELLLGYAKAARQQHPKCPVFVCHDVAARYGERPWAMPNRDFDDLERALTEASQSGDMRTVLRIQDLLGAASSPFAEAPDDEEFPEDELALVGGDVRVQLEELIRLVGEKKFLEMIRKGLGKKAFGELERSAGRNNLLDVVLDLLIQVGPPPGFGMPPIMPFPGPIESRSAKPRKPSKPQRPKPSPGETPIMPTQRDLFDD